MRADDAIINLPRASVILLNGFFYFSCNKTKIYVNEISKEINAKIAMTNKSYFGLLPLFRSGNICCNTKVMVHKTIVGPAVTYVGC